jgi:hypothetical protein
MWHYYILGESEMVHNVPARKEAKALREKALELTREAKTLEGIDGAGELAEAKADQVKKTLGDIEDLKAEARLQDLNVWKDTLVKQTKKGERAYYRWVAAWREGSRYKKVYLGSCRKLTRDQALQKARKLKGSSVSKTRPPRDSKTLGFVETGPRRRLYFNIF